LSLSLALPHHDDDHNKHDDEHGNILIIC
jgi:hypothetical protein